MSDICPSTHRTHLAAPILRPPHSALSTLLLCISILCAVSSAANHSFIMHCHKLCAVLGKKYSREEFGDSCFVCNVFPGHFKFSSDPNRLPKTFLGIVALYLKLSPFGLSTRLRKKKVLPDSSNRDFEVSLDYLNKGIRMEVSLDNAQEVLNKIQLSRHIVNRDKKVIVPPVRTDTIHACDIMEDLAIAYGYNNIQTT